MKSSNLSNGPIYSILAVYMPLTALTALVFLIDALIPLNFPLTLVLTSGFLSALAASLYCDFMKGKRSVTADIRGGIIIIIFFYIFASLLRQGIPWIDKFKPNVSAFLSSAGAIYIWVNVNSLKHLFNVRKRFEAYSENYQGRQLQDMLLEDSGLLQYTDEKINKTWNNYLFQLVVIGIFAVICMASGIKLHFALYFLLLIILAGSINLYGFFQIIKWEQYYAGEGINLSAYDRTKRIFAMIIISVFCITAAVLLASNKSLLPFSAVVGFFIWFFSLFNYDAPPSEIVRNTDALTFPNMTFDIPFFEEKVPSPVAEFLAKYGLQVLKYLLIFIVSAVFIKFMISPLLNREKNGNKISFRKRLILIIKEWFNSLLTAIASIYLFLKNNRKMMLSKKRSEEINRAAASLFEAYSPAKKRNMKQSVTLFARLIIWGSEERDVTWRPSYAPAEYCDILAAAAPDDEVKNEGIVRCGEIFEKALYSADVLSGEEEGEFKRLVEEITVVV
jgi:hypothetical protein